VFTGRSELGHKQPFAGSTLLLEGALESEGIDPALGTDVETVVAFRAYDPDRIDPLATPAILKCTAWQGDFSTTATL
jgi:hypothetical protein